MPRGGKREGAGRPAGSKNKIKKTGQGKRTPFANVTVSGHPDEIADLKELAKESGKSLSRFVLDTLLNAHYDFENNEHVE